MDHLMTLPEVAEFLRIPESTLRYWRHVKAGPRSAKLGARIAYRRADVEQWLAEQFEKSDHDDAA